MIVDYEPLSFRKFGRHGAMECADRQEVGILSKCPHPNVEKCFYDPIEYPYICTYVYIYTYIYIYIDFIFRLKNLTFITKPYILDYIMSLTTFYSIDEKYIELS